MDQDVAMQTGVAVAGAAMFIQFLISLAVYVLCAIGLMKISQKLGKGTPWWAWVPILNIILFLEIAGKPAWWVVLMFIPFVNIVVGIIACLDFAVACGKEKWMGILVFLFAPIMLPIWGFEK